MFQLIVAIISIALIAALAAASIFYGGSAFTDSSLKANVTTLVNGGQQISGAQAIYKTDNAGAPALLLSDLTLDGEYLAAAPTPANIASGPWSLSTDGTHAVINLTAGAGADKVCELVSTQNNGATAAGPAADAEVTGGTYACDTDGTTAASFFAFKL